MKVSLIEHGIYAERRNLKISNGEKCRFPAGYFDFGTSKDEPPLCRYRKKLDLGLLGAGGA